jgi:hypothetical protein
MLINNLDALVYELIKSIPQKSETEKRNIEKQLKEYFGGKYAKEKYK